MKKIFLLLCFLTVMSCSTDDDNNQDSCASDITEQYQQQIDWVSENTDPIDFVLIGLLKEERDLRIQENCN